MFNAKEANWFPPRALFHTEDLTFKGTGMLLDTTPHVTENIQPLRQNAYSIE